MNLTIRASVALAMATVVLSMCFTATLSSELSGLAREKRQNSPPQESSSSEPESGSGYAEGEAAPPSGGGVSLGKILGIAFLACCIIYCVGISWKVYKVCKGTYVEEEPVFLKYK